jgi:hypothetical protein
MVVHIKPNYKAILLKRHAKHIYIITVNGMYYLQNRSANEGEIDYFYYINIFTQEDL